MSFVNSNSLTSGNKLSNVVNVLAEISDKQIATNINILLHDDPNLIEELFSREVRLTLDFLQYKGAIRQQFVFSRWGQYGLLN